MIDSKNIITLCKEFYNQKTEASVSFFNSLADFFSENKDTLVAEDIRPYVNPLYNVWTENALPEILEGRIFISEAFINSIATQQLTANSSALKSIDVNCYGSGSIDFMISHTLGKFLIKGEINELCHNNHKSNLVFCISQKQVMNDGLGKLFSQLTMNVTNNFLEKTLNGSFANGLTLTYGSDVLTIDFSDYVKKSVWKKYKFMDRPLSDWVIIEKAFVVDGGIEIRLKYRNEDF